MAKKISNNAASATNNKQLENTHTPEQHMTNKLEEQWKQTWLLRQEIKNKNPHRRTKTRERTILHIPTRGGGNKKAIIEKLFHQKDTLPVNPELTYQEKHAIGKLFLKTHERKNNDTMGNTEKLHTCPTCGKIQNKRRRKNTDHRQQNVNNNGNKKDHIDTSAKTKNVNALSKRKNNCTPTNININITSTFTPYTTWAQKEE